MQRLGLQPDAQSFTAAIGACANCGRWEEALQMLRRAEMETTPEPETIQFGFVNGLVCTNIDQTWLTLD